MLALFHSFYLNVCEQHFNSPVEARGHGRGRGRGQMRGRDVREGERGIGRGNLATDELRTCRTAASAEWIASWGFMKRLRAATTRRKIAF